MADEEDKKPAAEKAEPADGEEGTEEGAEAAAAAAKKKRMFIILCVVIAIVGVAVAGGIYFMLQGGKKHEEEAPAPVFYDMPPIAVNLLGNSDSDEAHYLKLKLAFELANQEDAAKVAAMLPLLQDDYQAFLRQMRLDDLRGSAALARLKDALLLRANQVLAPVVVKNVLFRELLAQ